MLFKGGGGGVRDTHGIDGVEFPASERWPMCNAMPFNVVNVELIVL